MICKPAYTTWVQFGQFGINVWHDVNVMTTNLPRKQMETTGSDCAWQFMMTIMATVRMVEASIAPVRQTTPVEEWAPAWWNGTKTQTMFEKIFRWKWHVARNRFKHCPGVSDMGALPADVSSWGFTFVSKIPSLINTIHLSDLSVPQDQDPYDPYCFRLYPTRKSNRTMTGRDLPGTGLKAD